MNTFIRGLCCACALIAALPANAAIKVLATTSDWGSLVTELGGDKVNVYTATSPLQDVHRVDATRPIEETMQGLAQLVQEGKIARIGLCEVSAATLRRHGARRGVDLLMN